MAVGASQGRGLDRGAADARAEGFSSASKLSIAYKDNLAEIIQGVSRKR